MVMEVVECLKGICDDNLVYSLLKEQSTEIVNQIKSTNVSDIKSYLLPLAMNISQELIGPILPGICVNASQTPFFILFAPDGSTAKKIAEDTLKGIKTIVDIIFERDTDGRTLFSQVQCR